MKTGHHSVFDCHYHLVLVTKYRHKCITAPMHVDLKQFVLDMLPTGVILEECNGEADHLHLLLAIPPHVSVSKLVNSIKTATSRRIRIKYSTWLEPFYWKPYFWARSYCLVTTGGATLELVKRYIQSQSEP